MVDKSELKNAPSLRYMDAFNRASYGHNPIQKIDIFLKTAADVTLNKVRGMGLSTEIDKPLTEMAAETARLITYVASGDFTRAGDKNVSNRVAARMNAYFDSANTKPSEFGQYDVYMAAGWKPKGQVILNGVKTTLNAPIDNMLAVFIRNKDGTIEIIDPSVKVKSMEELYKFPSQYLKTDNPHDRKWNETAGAYVYAQFLPMLAGGAISMGGKGIAALDKAGELASVTNKIKQAGHLTSAFGMAQLGAIGVEGGASLINGSAVDKLVDQLTDSISNPSKITPRKIMDALNSGLHDYSFDKNTSNQIYIPSLSDEKNTWERLNQVLKGRVDGYKKPNNPWEKWKADSRIEVPDIEDKLKNNPKMMSAYYGCALKAVSGKDLSDQEAFILRIGNGLITGAKVNISGLSFTDKEKSEIANVTRDIMTDELSYNIDKHPRIAKEFGIDIKKFDNADYVNNAKMVILDNIDDRKLSMYLAEMKIRNDNNISPFAVFKSIKPELGM